MWEAKKSLIWRLLTQQSRYPEHSQQTVKKERETCDLGGEVVLRILGSQNLCYVLNLMHFMRSRVPLIPCLLIHSLDTALTDSHLTSPIRCRKIEVRQESS